ncbi:hypothetical protein OC846_000842 [Tilletia horrida]|uniref:FAD-dependent oxidoreductase 2 FAD-binding domain-containing protein n=1 Tax=Tilletia horrida TaxID=155126 RepID=A0AAN6JUA7_9BASI|nr:hypothetical protein OC846_000842 [Tilletia horrida]
MTSNGEASTATPPADTVLIVGGGLAGLVAAFELTKAGKHVTIIDQEHEASLGGQAWWSLGGIFLVDSPQQRRLGIKDSFDIAKRDWFNSAQFDDLEDEDFWGSKWAEAYLEFAHKNMYQYLKDVGVGFVPQVGWAERGSGQAGGHGNSLPRFHITYGTGEEIVRVFRDPVLKAAKEKNLVTFKYRHQVDSLLQNASGRVIGVKGTILEPTEVKRGQASSRKSIGEFTLQGRAVLISTGGIGGNLELVKEMWPVEKLGGKVPEHFVLGVPAHVDGRGLKIAEQAGARLVNKDRFWHYTEGLANWNSIWPKHGIRVIPGPSSLWLDATGKRLPPPLFPGCDTLATLKYICSTGYDYTWFILDKSIVLKEFALSGSEQNPDITQKSVWLVLQRLLYGPEPVKKFMEHGDDFVVADHLTDLVNGMNAKAKQRNGPQLKYEDIYKIIEDRDIQLKNKYSKDAQLMLINNARAYWGDRLTRVVKPHAILDPAYGPLIAIRMNLLTRKTLGGIQTDLQSRVIQSGKGKGSGEVVEGLYAAGEVAGFGGGGVMGHNALEGIIDNNMGLNALGIASVVFLVLYAILFGLLVIGFSTGHMKFKSRWSLVLFHVLLRLAAQSVGIAFAVVGYKDIGLLIAYLVLGAEGYFSLVLCTARYLISFQTHAFGDSWIEPKSKGKQPFSERFKRNFNLGILRRGRQSSDSQESGAGRTPIVVIHYILIGANTIIIVGGSLLAGSVDYSNGNGDLVDASKYNTGRAMRTAGAAIFLAINLVLIACVFATTKQYREKAASRGIRTPFFGHPFLLVLVAISPFLVIRGIFGILQACVESLGYYSPETYSSDGLRPDFVVKEAVLVIAMEWTTCALLVLTWPIVRSHGWGADQVGSDDKVKHSQEDLHKSEHGHSQS